MIKKVELSTLQEGQLLQRLKWSHMHDTYFEDEEVCDGRYPIVELEFEDVFVYLEHSWKQGVELTMRFLFGTKIYKRTFVGRTDRHTIYKANKFLSNFYNPMDLVGLNERPALENKK